jgi:hypothetical protein
MHLFGFDLAELRTLAKRNVGELETYVSCVSSIGGATVQLR